MFKEKHSLIKIFLFYSFIVLSSYAFAEENYYLTLRNDKVNLRQGPSLKHPVKLVYKKKFLPVLIQDKSGNFRKILDHENNSGWIHITQLSKKRAAINIDEKSIIFKKSSVYSKPIAVLDKGRLCLVKKCKNNWCKIKSGNHIGWVKREKLRGRL